MNNVIKIKTLTGCSGKYHIWSLLLSSHSAPHRQEVRVQLLDPTMHQSNSSSHDIPSLENRSSISRDVAGGSVKLTEAGLPSDERTKVGAVMNVNVQRTTSHNHTNRRTYVFTSCLHLLPVCSRPSQNLVHLV